MNIEIRKAKPEEAEQIIDINMETIPTNHMFKVLVSTKIVLSIKIVKNTTLIMLNVFIKLIITLHFQILIYYLPNIQHSSYVYINQ